MTDIKRLLQRNRLFLEILGMVVLGEFAVMLFLDYLAPSGSALQVELLDAFSLALLVGPFIFWRSRAVHGREVQILSEAVQLSSTAVLLLDIDGRIDWLNAGFTQMSGYTLEEVIGRRPNEILDSGQTDAKVLATLKTSLGGCQPCRAIVCNRHKDGSHYFVDVDFRPHYDKRGKLVGFIEICTDITELKRTERALEASLRESRALLQTMNTHAIVSVADRSGRIMDVNAAFCAISGYSAEQLIGQDHKILNSGTHSPEFWLSMWADISNGRPWRGEICNRNSQGQLYWVDSMIAPLLGVDGRVEKYVSMRLDITARKVSELELERQTQLLAEVVDASPYGLAVYDEQQILRLHNAQFEEMLALPPELLSRKPCYFAEQIRYQYARGDYSDAQSLDAVLARLQNAMAARESLILERRQFDGRHIELRAYPIANGWTVLNYRDNTERKAKQLQLVEALERVRLATESAGIGIWSLNTVTGEQSWDQQQYRLFGVDGKTHAARKIYDLWSEHLHPEDAEAASEAFQHTINTGMPFDHVFRIIRPDGAVRYIKALGSPRMDADRRVEYIFGTNMDVTDATLLAEIMKDARDNAEEAVLAKTQFMTNMSHEMRTPMNAVLGILKLLSSSDVSSIQRHYIDSARRASHMMVVLIDQVLEYAQLNSGIVLLVPKPFRLEEVLQPLSDMVLGSVGTKEIEVLFDLDPRLPALLFGDKQRLQQVLGNLLGNAIKFTLSGEVICRIGLQNREGDFSRLTFCIQDTGIGVAPEHRQRVFQSFTQVESTTTRAFGGVGLGLPISQRLVELMGGSIALESTLGVGSSFSFALDLAMPDENPVLQPVLSPPSPSQAVLLVDDSRTSLGLISAMASQLQWCVSATDSAMAAMAMIQSGLAPGGTAFTLLLLDWNLPDLESTQMVPQIRSLYRDAQQPQPCIILLSNNANPVCQQRMLDLAEQVNANLAKPFTASMLQAAWADAKGRMPRAALPELPALPTLPAPPLQSQRLKGLRILAVDDVAINQTVIQQLLTMEGAVVTLAANGRLGVDAALAAPMETGFDVVLMDIQMPVMDGYEATRLIRKVPHLVNLPIIAVTANVLDSDIAQCRAAGMNHHVGKPYDLDQLVGVICGAIGRSAAAPDSSPAVAQTPAAPSAEIQPAKQPSQVYWVSTTAQPTEAERAALLQKGVALNVLESVEALASLRETNAPAGLLVVDQAIATSPELRALGTGRTGVSMKAMPVIALAEVATEVEMRECLLAGAVDMVPRQFALNCLNALGARYLDEQGQPRADVQQKVAAIDSQHAMQHMQSDVTFFGSLLHAFFEELPGRKKQLQDDWLHKPQQIKHHSHALKGLALTLGLHHLAELARQVESQSASGARLEPELLAQLEGELQSAGFQILRWLQLHRDVLEVTQ